MPRTILIDTDTASDDAIALIMAMRAPDVHIAAITVVAGNVPVQTGVRNALYTAELCDSSAPVFAGAAKPLLRPLQTADWFHGIDGLGDHGYAPRQRQAEALHAVDAIVQTVLANPGIEVIALGPMTNLALALAREPRIAGLISRCVVMGGAPCCEGNVTPAAEYNIWADPDAARMVFQADLAIEMVGWQLSRGDAVVGAQDIDAILALDTPLAEFAIRCNSTAAHAYHEQTGEVGIALPDPIAMAILLQPALCTAASAHAVDIETASELTRGMTVVDRLHVTGNERNRALWSQRPPRMRQVQVCWTLDVAGWKAALRAALG